MARSGQVPGSRSAARVRDTSLAVGDSVQFSADAFRGIFSGRVFKYTSEVVRQASILVTGSVLIIFGLVFALGLVVGIQGSYAAQQVGAPAVAGAFAAIADLREIGPYAFGYMMAAKVSTGYVAEIGTMRITDEVDALDVMGFDSLVYLASTRLLGMLIVIPFVYTMAIIVSYIGSFLAVVIQLGQVSAGGYLELFWKFQSPQDLLFSFSKGIIMSIFLVLVGCYYGFRVRGGPVEVGAATARAMVVNLVGIHVIGIVTSQIFWGGTPRLPIGG